MEDVVLVGRGKSVETFDWPDLPIAAVSSGVFVKQLPRRPDYWFALDTPRFFINPQKRWRYFDDPNVQWFDVCNTDIEKHVPIGDRRVEPLFDLFRACPPDNLPDDTLPSPNWGVFPNVHAWNYSKQAPATWEGDLIGGNCWGNTLPFALQILWWLGYKRVIFAGIEWSMPGWQEIRRQVNELRDRSPLVWPLLEV